MTVICHWFGAVLMIAFLVAAFSTLGLEGAEALQRRNMTLELGLLAMPFFVFRLYWRLANYYPAPLGGVNPAQVLVGRGIAIGMLLAGIVLPVLFWAKEAGSGSELKAFDLTMPALSTPLPFLAPLFWLGVTAFLLGLALHLFGAYTHQIVLKDETLKRLIGLTVEL